jgi:hypothetical protein
MKLKLTALVFLSGALLLRGQGTFVWDQQVTGPIDANALLNFDQPLGQAFTPSFDSIDVAAFYLGGPTVSMDVEVNLRSGSITGTILGTTAPITINPSDSGPFDFLFSNPITLTPGVTYFLQPVAITSVGSIFANAIPTSGRMGGAIVDGVPKNTWNFWFQEGVVNSVPEPSSAALLLIGSGVMYWHRRKWRMGKLCNGNG